MTKSQSALLGIDGYDMVCVPCRNHDCRHCTRGACACPSQVCRGYEPFILSQGSDDDAWQVYDRVVHAGSDEALALMDMCGPEIVVRFVRTVLQASQL